MTQTNPANRATVPSFQPQTRERPVDKRVKDAQRYTVEQMHKQEGYFFSRVENEKRIWQLSKVIHNGLNSRSTYSLYFKRNTQSHVTFF